MARALRPGPAGNEDIRKRDEQWLLQALEEIRRQDEEWLFPLLRQIQERENALFALILQEGPGSTELGESGGTEEKARNEKGTISGQELE